MLPNENEPWWRPALNFMAQISAWIAGPIILALLLGSWLDERYQTGSRYLIICVAVAFLVTNFGLVKKTIEYRKTLAVEDEKLKKEKNLDKYDERTDN